MGRFKFRAWDDQQKEWITDCDLYMMSTGEIYAGDMDNPPIVHIKQELVSFSTGLKDKYGIEIYEGDILEFADKNFLVIWEDYRFNLKDFYEFYLDYPTEAFSESLQFKVIGNIHEHPHLLEEERT